MGGLQKMEDRRSWQEVRQRILGEKGEGEEWMTELEKERRREERVRVGERERRENECVSKCR